MFHLMWRTGPAVPQSQLKFLASGIVIKPVVDREIL